MRHGSRLKRLRMGKRLYECSHLKQTLSLKTLEVLRLNDSSLKQVFSYWSPLAYNCKIYYGAFLLISLSHAATKPGNTKSISNMAISAPIDKEILTSDIIAEEARAPRAASTSTRIDPDVIIVWIELS